MATPRCRPKPPPSEIENKELIQLQQEIKQQVLIILEMLYVEATWRGILHKSGSINYESLKKIRNGDISSAYARLNKLLQFDKR